MLMKIWFVVVVVVVITLFWPRSDDGYPADRDANYE